MKYDDLRKLTNKKIFSINDMELVNEKIYSYQLNLWAKKEYLIQLKRGIYAFTDDLNKIMPEEVSIIIYRPSYISLEKALFIYGFIPEITYSFTNVTAKTNRIFNNKFGRFIYRHIKPELFWGYKQKVIENGMYLIAEPEKAILDYLYLNISKINSKDDFENIRFNYDSIKENIDSNKFENYIKAFNIKKLKKWAELCLR